MRCFIEKNTTLNIDEYKTFLEDVFKTSFKKCKISDDRFHYLKSSDYKRYCLIRGENYSVLSLLKKIRIEEKYMIILSCTIEGIVKVLKNNGHYSSVKNKVIYCPKYSEDGEFLTYYNGEKYRCDFNPCKAELMLGRDSNKIDALKNLYKHFNIITVAKILSK